MSLRIGSPVQYEPKRSNHFYLEFPDELNIETWLIQTMDRPKIAINAVPIHYFNSQHHVAGKVTFNTLNFTLLSHVGPSTEQKLMEWIRLCYESITNRMGYAFGYKKDLVLKTTDPTGVGVEKFMLKQCQVTNVDFGSNSYASDELIMPSVTVQPDWVVHNY